jgi:primosomal protein N' (replication factor Y) (superfamily II helicase)
MTSGARDDVIADVAFDAPLDHPFSYAVPERYLVAPGQRVLAPLKGTSRVGVVVAVREASAATLKPLVRAVDSQALLGPEQLVLVHWIAGESLASFGSTCLALLPPADPAGARHASVQKLSVSDRPSQGEATPGLLTGAGREARLMALLVSGPPALVLTPDLEAVARWAQRLAKLGRAVRLDSSVDDAERADAWAALASGEAAFAVGTRSALLGPLPPGGRLAVIDEHEIGHKPPGHPRMHTREAALERAARERLQAVLTSGTPSVEMWWRASARRARLDASPPAPWPAVAIADTRGIARREALTPALSRAIRETLAAGRRVFLGVSRLSSMLGCDECGAILKCSECAIALAYSPAGRTLACRLCGAAAGLPELCPSCRGRRLMPFGWGAERVEHAVRRRFSRARIARYDPEAGRGRRGEAQREAAVGADIVIGTRGALRLFGPASLGLAGFVSPDQMLGLPDFRAAERSFGMLWAAAERLRSDGALIIQSQNPTHYALQAVAGQDLKLFYDPELRFRADLGYPPFRRLAIITISGPNAAAATQGAQAVGSALAGAPGLTVYPATSDRRNRARRIVVKGGPELPRQLEAALREARTRRGAGSRGIIDVEVDPVEWPF